MDYGDIIRLIIFGFIFLSFFGGIFGRNKKDEEKGPEQQGPRPARPTELSESGGPPQPRPRPVVIAEPAGPITVFADDSTAEYEARRPESGQRSRDPRSRDPRPREALESDIRDTERGLLERDITDMPTIAEDLDAENRPRRRRGQAQRRQRQVEGGDVLRDSLKNPATLERAFIVKEVLDRPLGLRNGR